MSLLMCALVTIMKVCISLTYYRLILDYTLLNFNILCLF